MKTYTGTLYIHVLDNLYIIIYIKFYFNSIMTKLMVKNMNTIIIIITDNV